MSAIAGLLLPDGATAEERRVAAMVGAMRSRGPHRVGTFTAGAVGLGHGALFTTADARDELQPLHDASAGLTIVADLRLDARDELARTLGLDGPLPGDAALALAAYERFGLDFATHLLGDFALAIWDAPKRRLVLARDVFGARPLRYVHRGERFAFASDTAGLRPSGVPLGGPDRGRIADYLASDVLEASDATSTFLTGVKRLPPAHVLVAERGGVRVRRYWSLDASRPIDHRGDHEIAEAFRETFERAVRDRMRTASGVGSMLSGGLDSSAIVAVARDLRARVGDPPLPTFSVTSRDPRGAPDTRNAEAVISAGGLEPTRLSADDLGARAGVVRRFLEASDDPFDSSALCVPLLSFDAAARSGLHVLLDGADGDVATSLGTATIRYALQEGRPLAAWREAQGQAALFGDASVPLFARYGLGTWLGRAALRRLPLPLVRLQRDRARRATVRRLLADAPIEPGFAREIDLAGRLVSQQLPLDARTPAAELAHLLETAIVPAGLERYDRAAAFVSVEARHPFFDRRLVELCATMPWDVKASGGVPKRLLRRMLVGRVPEEVLVPRWDPNLSSVVRPALARLLRDWCLDTLARADHIAGGYVRQDSLARARETLRAGRVNDAGEVWQLVAFVSWLERSSEDRNDGQA